jgi:hypothetical protein
MTSTRRLYWSLLRTVALAGFVFSSFVLAQKTPRVDLLRVPDNGIQPQTAVASDGTVHLVYFKGDPAVGELFYARSQDGRAFSPAIRINSTPGTAVAVGNIRGARIELGRKGRVFVIWNGSAKAGDPAAGRSPMFFSRLNDEGTAFEPQRNLIHSAYGIDGGGGIAADARGRVYVFWHAPVPGRKGEENRRVWITRSDDDGKTFDQERIAWDRPTGTCGCCSLNAAMDQSGTVYVLFRSAEAMVHRDMYLLESTDRGATFRGADISKWNVGYCVMSSEAFASGAARTFAAWETEKRVHFGSIGAGPVITNDTLASQKETNQKYPALAVNQDGLLLVSWTEGMGWKHGGSLAWQVFDPQGRRLGEEGRSDGVPTWSLVATYPVKGGNFVVLY